MPRPVTMALKTFFQTLFQNLAVIGGIRVIITKVWDGVKHGANTKNARVKYKMT